MRKRRKRLEIMRPFAGAVNWRGKEPRRGGKVRRWATGVAVEYPARRWRMVTAQCACPNVTGLRPLSRSRSALVARVSEAHAGLSRITRVRFAYPGYAAVGKGAAHGRGDQDNAARRTMLLERAHGLSAKAGNADRSDSSPLSQGALRGSEAGYGRHARGPKFAQQTLGGEAGDAGERLWTTC